jgi:hypothetical protein
MFFTIIYNFLIQKMPKICFYRAGPSNLRPKMEKRSGAVGVKFKFWDPTDPGPKTQL